MARTDFHELAEQARTCMIPEQLFVAHPALLARERPPREILNGVTSGTKHLPGIQEEYERIRKVLETPPRDFEGDLSFLLGRLERLYEDAVQRSEAHVFGLAGFEKDPPLRGMKSFRLQDFEYFVGDKLETSTEIESYAAYLQYRGRFIGEVVIRKSRSAQGNALLQKEKTILRRIQQIESSHWGYYPFVLHSFAAGAYQAHVRKRMNAFSAEAIRRIAPRGVDERHVVWMFDRWLAALGFAHDLDIVHQNVHPGTLLVQPITHNGILDDWGSAVSFPTSERNALPQTVFTAPELSTGEPIGPWTDLYSLGKSVIFLLGGDPESNALPRTVAPEFASLILSLVEQDSVRRPQSVWGVYEAQHQLKRKLWGEKFLFLNVGNLTPLR